VEQSLRRLKTDVIDLYQTHWQENTTPIEDTMAELLRLKDQGKIRAIGASNVTVDHIKGYLGAGQLDVVQNRYSMLDRADERDILPFCKANNIAYLAYSPMAMGLLTGKIGPDRKFGPGDIRARQPRFSVENRQRVQTLLSEFKPIAEGRGLTMAQLVTAWTAEQPGLTHVLAGARNPQQAKENAKAGSVELSSEELVQMNAAIEKCAGQIV
jgi:aryl-alcohol dehydrogenase-like predicted oxidoreductase